MATREVAVPPVRHSIRLAAAAAAVAASGTTPPAGPPAADPSAGSDDDTDPTVSRDDDDLASSASYDDDGQDSAMSDDDDDRLEEDAKRPAKKAKKKQAEEAPAVETDRRPPVHARRTLTTTLLSATFAKLGVPPNEIGRILGSIEGTAIVNEVAKFAGKQKNRGGTINAPDGSLIPTSYERNRGAKFTQPYRHNGQSVSNIFQRYDKVSVSCPVVGCPKSFQFKKSLFLAAVEGVGVAFATAESANKILLNSSSWMAKRPDGNAFKMTMSDCQSLSKAVYNHWELESESHRPEDIPEVAQCTALTKQNKKRRARGAHEKIEAEKAETRHVESNCEDRANK